MATIELEVDVGDLQDGQMKEVPFGEKKVLVSKIKGQYYATSHLCTHYKAPLANGTLSLDGRLVCQWHGACFHVQTGDIEDAPGLDSLISYQVRVVDGKVFVSANEDDLKNVKRSIGYCRPNPSDSRTVVIIGGGTAAYGAIESLRHHKFGGRIIVITKEPHGPIDRIKLSKSIDIKVDKVLLRSEEHWKELAVTFLYGVEATKVDPSSKRVHLSNEQTLSYDKLLIATGGVPRNFWSNQTASLKNVVVIRSINDANNLAAALATKPKGNIVIIGSSFIGMEAASTLSKAGKVTVIGPEKVPFELIFGSRIGAAFQKLHETNGATFKLQSSAKEFESTDGTCTGVILQSGEHVPADVVVIGVGVSPATHFLQGTFPLEKDGSIIVDEHLQIPGHPDIFVAGDIARFPFRYPTGSDHSHIRVEHWDVAMQQGRVAGQNMAGGNAKYNNVPFFWTMQLGKNIRYCGHALSFDDIIVDGDVENFSFVAYFVKGEQVLAVASVARDPIVSKCSELIRIGSMPTASELRAGKSPLTIPTSETANSSL